MDRLLEGYTRFRGDYWPRHGERLLTLAREGQHPPAMVIACCDSRVAPEIIFDCRLGEIFVVRSIANLVPPYAPDEANHGTSAALEYAVRELQVRHIVVLGHSQCGGIRFLMQGPPSKPTDFIGNWMKIATQAAQQTRLEVGDHAAEDAICRHCEQESIRISLSNLLTFPWIQSRAESGELSLLGLYFDVESGDLKRIDWPDHPERRDLGTRDD